MPRAHYRKTGQDNHHQDYALREVVQNGVGCKVNQIAAVDKRHDLNAGRQNVVVQLLDFFVNAHQRGIGIRSFAQQNNSRDHIVVVDDFAVFFVYSSRKLT